MVHGAVGRGGILAQGGHGRISCVSELRAIPSLAFWSYLKFFLYLFYYFEAGLFLTIAPWSEGWDQNLWLWYSPGLGDLLRSGYLRGALSAIGIMHLVWGILEALEAARAAGKRSAGA